LTFISLAYLLPVYCLFDMVSALTVKILLLVLNTQYVNVIT
jgi:hypothetical protein